MDALISRTKQLFPDVSDDEAEEMITTAKKAAPGANDEMLLSAIQSVKDDGDKSQQARNYVQQKYQLGPQYSPEARQALVDQNKEESSGLNWQAGLGALGAGLSGKDASAAGQAIANSQQKARDAKLSEFDKARDLAISDRDRTMTEEQKIARKDPNSDVSKSLQQMAVEDYGMNPEVASKIPAEILEARIPGLKYKAERADKATDLALRREDKANDLAFRREENSLRRDQLAADKSNSKLEKQTKYEEERKTPYGLANTPDDAKQLKEAYESKKNFDSKINEMIALREKHGGGATLNREDVGRGKQLSKDLLLEYKNMAKLGVLSKSDEDIINAIIPEDPLAYSFTPGQDPILHKLKKFKEDSDSDFSTKLATRLKDPSKTSTAGDFPKKVSKDGKTATVSNQTELDEAMSEGWS